MVTQEFLEYAKSQGNDLMTPAPHFSFPGLKPGDSWCVCARTWLAAVNEGAACPVDLEAVPGRKSSQAVENNSQSISES